MAEFLRTSGIAHHIENIIVEAKKKVILVSPYLKLSKTLHERLRDASKRGVKITIIYGKNELKPNEMNSLADVTSLGLFFFDNLHAKCYFNEAKMVITSMNMYETSEKTNREMGVLIDRIGDRDIFDNAMSETYSIMQSSEKIPVKKVEKTFGPFNTPLKDVRGKNTKRMTRGYCIRCEQRIDYDPSKPYCLECFTTWAFFENPNFQEKVCHRCGEYENTSMNKPQCYDCYQEWVEEIEM